jgi:hypothetical protein
MCRLSVGFRAYLLARFWPKAPPGELPTLLYLSSACERLKLDLSLGRPLSPCMLVKATSGTNEQVVDFLKPDTGLIGKRGVLCVV